MTFFLRNSPIVWKRFPSITEQKSQQRCWSFRTTVLECHILKWTVLICQERLELDVVKWCNDSHNPKLGLSLCQVSFLSSPKSLLRRNRKLWKSNSYLPELVNWVTKPATSSFYTDLHRSYRIQISAAHSQTADLAASNEECNYLLMGIHAVVVYVPSYVFLWVHDRHVFMYVCANTCVH